MVDVCHHLSTKTMPMNCEKMCEKTARTNPKTAVWHCGAGSSGDESHRPRNYQSSRKRCDGEMLLWGHLV